MTWIERVVGVALAGLRRVVPLRMRTGIVRWLGGNEWVPYRDWLSIELFRDAITRDPDAAHRFLWSNHLAYAESYRVDKRFGADRLDASRRLLFDDLLAALIGQGVRPGQDIRSVFEVGCSLGYLLRHLETDVFPGAADLEGIDIDRHAIADGTRRLASLDSRVRLRVADMSDLDRILEDRVIDVILCAGVLLYLTEAEAAKVVASLIRHTGRVAAITGVAHPDQDNSTLAGSIVRQRDGAHIHNLDEMVAVGGGRVIARRWEGARQLDSTSIYFVFATAASS